MDGVFMRIKKFLKKIYAIQFKELRLYFGKTNKKIKYVIRFFPREGLMSMLYKACGHVEYALRKGYVPVVDIEHFRTVYKACTWSDFFELRIQGQGCGRLQLYHIQCRSAQGFATVVWQVLGICI